MRVFTVDSFTDKPFRGNPAGVCLLDNPVPDEWMQAVAAEMRHSETAFVADGGDGGPYALRWFTPAVEVALCGHATLATAHVLYSLGARGRLEFATKSGVLATEQSGDDLIAMDFPAAPPEKTEAPDGLAEALGVTPVWVGRSRFDVLAEVESADVVRALRPDVERLTAVDARGVIVTAPGDGTADFVSRFFAPRVGVPEDPVTGSAHCVLSPYWSGRLGRDALVGAQVSERGGTVRTTLRGDRVELAGHAVTVWSGELQV
ncbi:PhzF family phenazine biosynthesis protein [Microbispora sp. ATCC PTA-5024]|uniref:PhzF family phenazine biosynthesis protein n=1 Tax=Microbispora sp. ATCC PTA-5024 TaxID=316330 RepID=UPI0003DDBDEE|nr:PhzF family phenazine biosynthesis protein [Microbispora sp. ATCC PTA-5024]ETK33753.1 phenazine biosynthesis protein PhzF family [Microbispora sp. ATCC PTA-5024]